MIIYSEDASGSPLPEAWVVDGRTQRVAVVVQGTIDGLVIKGQTIPWSDIGRIKELALSQPGAVAALRRANETA